ncbi:hypothetical protein ACIGMX_34540 [Streptomyces aquilus]|uniref:hypothetical protein n=1 Tax=Streptomyces aquilus TaxID=2548456 RepID=UPI0037CEDCAE
MPEKQPTPESPITELAAGAAQLHEPFTSYLHAGFTESQALRLIIGMIRPNRDAA